MMTKKDPSARSDSHAPNADQLKQAAQHQLTKSSCCQGSIETKTRIIVKYDVGFGNTLYIRGKGATLSWDKGTPLKNIKKDEWVWETEQPFHDGEFKVLINDKHYEIGLNHPLRCGASLQYNPRF